MISRASFILAERLPLKNAYDYAAFGESYTPNSSVTVDQRYTYTSQEQDPTSGLMYYNYRHYSPATGRFLRRDPVSTYFSNMVPFTYQYVRNLPTKYSDPLGLWQCTGTAVGVVTMSEKPSYIVRWKYFWFDSMWRKISVVQRNFEIEYDVSVQVNLVGIKYNPTGGGTNMQENASDAQIDIMSYKTFRPLTDFESGPDWEQLYKTFDTLSFNNYGGFCRIPVNCEATCELGCTCCNKNSIVSLYSRIEDGYIYGRWYWGDFIGNIQPPLCRPLPGQGVNSACKDTCKKHQPAPPSWWVKDCESRGG